MHELPRLIFIDSCGIGTIQFSLNYPVQRFMVASAAVPQVL